MCPVSFHLSRVLGESLPGAQTCPEGRNSTGRTITALQADQWILFLQVSESTLNRYKAGPLTHRIQALGRGAFPGLISQEWSALEGGPKGSRVFQTEALGWCSEQNKLQVLRSGCGHFQQHLKDRRRLEWSTRQVVTGPVCLDDTATGTHALHLQYFAQCTTAVTSLASLRPQS